MSTIMNRVVGHLRAHGHEDEANELTIFIRKLTDNVNDLIELQQRQTRTTKRYINYIQSKCLHTEWYLADPAQQQIACVACGHTVCDERAYKFGTRVRQGDYSLYNRNGGKFALEANIKKQLIDKIKVKEIKDADKETLRSISNSDGTG